MDINSLAISAEQVSLYINLGMLGLLVIGLLGFFAGLIKGIWKKSFSILYYIIGFVILILVTKPIAKGLYNLNVYSLLNRFGAAIEGLNEINSSIGDYLRYLITNIFATNNIMTNDAIYLYVDGIALSLIQFTVFLIGMVILFGLSFILCPLLYNLIFKWFVPKKHRKHTKLRFVGGIIGFVEYILVFCLLLTPFSGLVNSVVLRLRSKDGKIIRNEENTNGVYNTMMEVVEGYNDSILGKLVFTVQINGKPIDVALMDYVTESNLSDKDKLNFYHEIGGIGAILVDAFASGAINLSEATLDIAKLIESSFIRNTFYTLAESSLVTAALPIAISIALSGMNENIDLSSIDLSDVDWSDTTRSIGDVFDAIKKTGYIHNAIVEPTNFINTINFSRENEPYLKEAVYSLGDSSLISTLMPQLIVSFLNSGKDTNNNVSLKKNSQSETNIGGGMLFDLAIFSNFPEEAFEVETYQSINWGNELVDMLNIVYMMADQYKSLDGKELYLTDIGSIYFGDFATKALLGLHEENDYSTDEVYKNNVYLNGGTVNGIDIYGTKAIFGCGKDKSVHGLLDLQIIDTLFVKLNMLPKFIPLIFDMAGNSARSIDKDDVVTRLENEVSDWNMENWKQEFGAILELSAPLKKSIDNMTSSNDVLDGLTKHETNVALSYVSDNLDSSYIMSNLFPHIAQNYVNNPENDKNLLFGLRMSDLNFVEFSEGKSFSTEFKVLINEFLPHAKSLKSNATEGVGLDTVVENNEDMKNALKAINKCEITNKKLSQKEINEGKTNNFEDIIINIFCEPTQEELDNGFDTSSNIPTLTDNLLVFDRNSVKAIKDGWDREDGSGELDGIFTFFASLKDDEAETNYIYECFSGSGNVNMATDIYYMGPEIERVFATVDESVLIKEAFPNTLTQMMADTDFSKSTDFNQVENWEDEGIAYNKLLTNIDTQRGNDKNKGVMDVMKESDKDIIKEYQFGYIENKYVFDKYHGDYHEYFLNESKAYSLLKDMYETQSINMSDILYDTLKDVLSPDGASDPMIDSETFATSKVDFDFEEKTIIYNLINSYNHYVSWELSEDSVNSLTYYGETFNFARLLGYSDVLDRLSSLEVDELDDLLKICVRSYPMRKLVGPLIEDTMLDMKATSGRVIVNLVDACDFDAFLRLVDPNRRVNEIDIRLIEVEGIIEVRSNKVALDYLDGYFDYAINPLTELDENDESNLTRLLNKMHRTELYNSSAFIANKGSNNTRNTLTSFEVTIKEIFNMNPNAFKEISNNDLYELNNRQSNDLWIDHGSIRGEIYNFNKALNNFVNSEVYLKVITAKPRDSYSVFKKLYLGNKTNHTEELVANLSSSILLEKQLDYIFDKHIYNSIKQAVLKNNTNSYKLAKETYCEFSKYENIIWIDEGTTIDNIYILMNKNKVDLSNLSKFDLKTSQELLNIVDQSKVLTYNSSLYDLDKTLSSNVERSFKEYLVNSFN